MKESNSQASTTRSRAVSGIVFCGDAEQLQIGFALALEAMAATPDLLTMEAEPVASTKCGTFRVKGPK